MSRWGPEGPPPEAYARVINPERFAPLHPFALELLDRLEGEFDVSREDGPGLDPERGERMEPTTRLVPSSPEAGTLMLALTSFPGVSMRLGHWYSCHFPSCGCDACDETLAGEREELERTVTAFISGGIREWIRLPAFGDAWRGSEMIEERESSRGESLIDRRTARRMIELAGGRREFRYAPWPRRRNA